MKNLILSGFMGSGKTTIAKVVSSKLGCNYLDIDECIEEMSNLKIKNIFKDYGEKYFRSLESKIVRKTMQDNLDNYIIATGGGTFLYEENAEILKNMGIVVYLNRSFDNIYKDISKDRIRPLILNRTFEEIRALYNERKQLYLKYADILLENNESLEECVKEVIKIMQMR